MPPNPTCGLGSRRMLKVERVVEHFLVEIGGAVDHYDPLALFDLHPGQLVVLEGGPLE